MVSVQKLFLSFLSLGVFLYGASCAQAAPHHPRSPAASMSEEQEEFPSMWKIDDEELAAEKKAQKKQKKTQSPTLKHRVKNIGRGVVGLPNLPVHVGANLMKKKIEGGGRGVGLRGGFKSWRDEHQIR